MLEFKEREWVLVGLGLRGFNREGVEVVVRFFEVGVFSMGESFFLLFWLRGWLVGVVFS